MPPPKRLIHDQRIRSATPLDTWNSSIFRTKSVPGRGSNPAHGDAERLDAATQSAEVFALPEGAARIPMQF
jgi:hypothetical protein